MEYLTHNKAEISNLATMFFLNLEEKKTTVKQIERSPKMKFKKQ